MSSSAIDLRSPEPLAGSYFTRQGLLHADRVLPAFYLPEHRGIRYS